MAEALTSIERRIYNYVVDYLKRETYQPSIREIGSRFGIRSTKTVTEHLQSLQRKGYLDRTPSRSRALRILGLDLSPETYTIPLYRNGGVELAEEDVEDRFDLDRAFACSPDCFMVRATGDCMRELGILDRDYLLVEPCERAVGSELAVYEQTGSIRVRRAEATASTRGGNGAAMSSDGRPEERFLGVVRAVFRSLPSR